MPYIIRKQSYFNISNRAASLPNNKCTPSTKLKTHLTSSDPSHSNSTAEVRVKT